MASIEVSTCVAVDGCCKISYLIFPVYNSIEFTLGGSEELVLITTEAGLRHCVTAFTSALDAFAAAASRLDETHAEFVPSADPPADRAE
ncbi:MAG: hypothetical protein ACRDRW_17945 [Pseudonocardiaceae bacterium]